MASVVLTAIGINWGSMMSHPMPPSTIVGMLRDNSIEKVKLFDADSSRVAALLEAGIEVMLGIPNDQLSHLSSKCKHAQDWVEHNITKYDRQGQQKIKYVAVGNEPLLASYNGVFIDVTFPALRDIQRALHKAGLGHRIKAIVPLNADIYNSPADNPVPSAGNFRNDIHQLMIRIVRFLHSNAAPFVVNIYPFLSLYQNPYFPLDFAFFGGKPKSLNDNGTALHQYVFDANYDTLVWCLGKAGVPDMKIIVGEIGWPTDGDKNASAKHAKRFYDGLLARMASGGGTPMRPERIEVYLFGLVDEDMKSMLPGNFERHWGIFTYDGRSKFPMDLTGQRRGNKYLVGAKGVEYLPKQWCVMDDEAGQDIFDQIPASVNYACSNAGCTPLGYGSSCNGLNQQGNVSYAFNVYFQTQDQDERACDFRGLAKIVSENASEGGCLFPVQIVSSSTASVTAAAAGHWILVVLMFVAAVGRDEFEIPL